MNRVPNEFPKWELVGKRMAVVGECPAAEEERLGRPFVGTSGRVLDNLLSRAGIPRDACLIANVCQVRPPGNKIERFKWDGEEIQSGLDQLRADLSAFKPNIVLVLGNAALKAFTGTDKVSLWRGSLLWGTLGDFQCKVLATYHPAAIVRQQSWKPLAHFDVMRAGEEAGTPKLELPERRYDCWLSKEEILERLRWIGESRSPMSFDIEGGTDMMTRCSIAVKSDAAFVIPFTAVGTLQSIWSEEDEQEIMVALKTVLENPQIPKILQTYAFDAFVLAYSYGISIRGLAHDTMVRWWELYSELDKSLAMQTSVLTREPYYKLGRKADAEQEAREYAAKDAAITFECCEKMAEHVPSDHLHYRFNMRMQEPLLYMQLKGFRYDGEGAVREAHRIWRKIHRLQFLVDRRSGAGPVNLFDCAKTALCYKKKLDKVESVEQLIEYAKPSCVEKARRMVEILNGRPLGPLALGEASRLCDARVNVDSDKQLKELLYEKLKEPKQFQKENGQNTDRLSVDRQALLRIYKHTKNPKLIRNMLALRSHLDALDQCEAKPDSDGRMRGSYNVVGTKTGRLSCQGAWTGNGYNLQTTSKRFRKFFLPDEGHWLFQCDLAGADGWTVAAYAAMLGDSTMLDDYRFGLKPAKILTLMFERGASVNSESRERLAELCKEVDKEGWKYFTNKRGQHGGSYGLGARTGVDQVLEDSFKLTGRPIYIEEATFKRIQNLFFLRYPGIGWWHEWTKKQLKEKGFLESAGGHRRVFFGPKNDHSTLKDALAELPQQNTTYATKLAIWRCWTDEENKGDDGSLIVEPLHTVHDSFICQAPKESLGFAQRKLREWFDNELMIAGHKIVIPAEMSYGPNWKDQEEFV